MISNLESTRRALQCRMQFLSNSEPTTLMQICNMLNSSAISSASSIYLNQIWMVEHVDKPNKGGVELLSEIKGKYFHTYNKCTVCE